MMHTLKASPLKRYHSQSLRIFFQSGRRYTIPAYHTVFVPCGEYVDGQVIDPCRCLCSGERADMALYPGQTIILDNRVEIVRAVCRLTVLSS